MTVNLCGAGDTGISPFASKQSSATIQGNPALTAAQEAGVKASAGISKIIAAR